MAAGLPGSLRCSGPMPPEVMRCIRKACALRPADDPAWRICVISAGGAYASFHLASFPEVCDLARALLPMGYVLRSSDKGEFDFILEIGSLDPQRKA